MNKKENKSLPFPLNFKIDLRIPIFSNIYWCINFKSTYTELMLMAMASLWFSHQNALSSTRFGWFRRCLCGLSIRARVRCVYVSRIHVYDSWTEVNRDGECALIQCINGERFYVGCMCCCEFSLPISRCLSSASKIKQQMHNYSFAVKRFTVVYCILFLLLERSSSKSTKKFFYCFSFLFTNETQFINSNLD